ncbi:MAG: hypothetical protein ACSHXL_03210 [Bacteroidota bacterium]
MNKLVGFTLIFISLTNYGLSQETQENRFKKEYYVSTNFASFIRDHRHTFPERNRNLTTNRYANIQFEWRLSEKFFLTVPIGIGLDNYKNHVDNNAELPNYYLFGGPNDLWPPGYYADGPKLNGLNESQSYINYQSKGYKSKPAFARQQDLIWQIGLFPKFQLTQSKRFNFTLTTGANFGQMDKYAITNYQDFTEVPSYTSDSIYNPSWKPTGSKNVYHSNPFFFARIEVTCGLDVKITSRFHLFLETGATHFIMANGKKSDFIMASLNGGNYYEVLEIHKNTDQLGEKEVNYHTHRKAVTPFYLINRFSLRYRFH